MPTAARAKALGNELAGTGPIPLDVRVAASPSEAVAHADVICTATTSASPVFSDFGFGDRRSHQRRRLIHARDAGDLPGKPCAALASSLDSRDAAVLAESGDLIQPIRGGLVLPGPHHSRIG